MNLDIMKKIILVSELKILIYVKDKRKHMTFENLTMVPIEKDLIIKENLTKTKKNGLMIIIKMYLKI